MKISIVTLFPEMFDSFKSTSIIKRALERNQVEIETIDFRSYTTDKHNHVDDTPYGGGAGMVLSIQPIADCIKAIKTEDSYVILMSPQGSVFKQSVARKWAKEIKHLIVICGHYEGFDERITYYIDEEVSIGDFILTGGECGAMVISDALIRLLDGVILQESHEDESFENGLLEYPHYTRPAVYDDHKVPDVLLSGHHENIRKWRLKQSLKRTLNKRADLLVNREFNKEELKMLEEIKQEE